MTSIEQNRQNLIALLQLAYSGERAAAYAYRGHWHSVTNCGEREAIRKDDEWRHRKLVGEMLAGLGARPSRMAKFGPRLLEGYWDCCVT